VVALHVGSVDTDMGAGYDGPKVDPADVAAALDGVEAGHVEVLADQFSADIKAALAADPNTDPTQPVPAA